MAMLRSSRHGPSPFRRALWGAAWMALLSAAWSGNPAWGGQGDGAPGGGYWYSYFKEQRSLKLDTTRVAVRAPDGDGAADTEPDLSRYGLYVSGLAPMAVRGWWFAETSAWARSDAAIERAVSRIAGGQSAEFVSPVFLDDDGDPVVITPYILVGFDRSLDPSRAEAILARSRAGIIVDRDWANMRRAYRLKSAARDGFDVLETANALARRPEVTFAEPDMLVTGHLARTPDDTYFPNLWALNNDGTFPPLTECTTLPDFDMDAPEAWDFTTGHPSIVVAVLDTGIQQDHPDLNLRTPGFDATGEGGGGNPVNECDNHGTQVAGCTSGIIDNGLGIVGVAPAVRSTSARMIVSNLSCDFSGTIASSWVVDALAWAESIGARITNSSWYRNAPSSAIDQKYADTRANGIVHFAAAGNDGMSSIRYPASLPSVNAVAALDPCGRLAVFSNFGVGLAFSAPGHYGISTDRTGSDGSNDGVDDGSCLPSGATGPGWWGPPGSPGCSTDGDCSPGDTCFLVSTDYALGAGTSFAAPYAAGVAALVLSVNPNLSADQVESVVQQSAVDLGPAGYDLLYGWGFVNAANAEQLALTISGTPGEAADLRVTSFDAITGNLNLSYTPACASSSHDIYYGPLSQLSSYGWSGSTCGIGNTGQYAGFNPGAGSYFFVVVGNHNADEGSYGTDSMGAQRPAAGASYCGRTQQLQTGCQ